MQPLFGRTERCGLIPLAVFVACTSSPIQWTAERTATQSGSAIALTEDGAVIDDALASLQARMTPPSALCAGSLRLSRSGARLFAVWWAPRKDSTALLASAFTSDEGTTWGAVVPVDTVDRGMTGCARAPASISADAVSGYVHVAYAMRAAEGPGIFYAHSMDGGVSFHSPVPILYGERLGSTSLAATGDRVIVAFEDPNSRTPRIGLALSRTMGHIFEDRILPVSDDNGAATQPLVAVRQHHITVAWRERSTRNGGAVLRLRSGTLP